MKTTLKISLLLIVITAVWLLFSNDISGYINRFINGVEKPAQCEDSIERLSIMHVEEIALLNDSGKIIKFDSHIANSNQERAAGYQHICEEVINKTTILFVYAAPVGNQFHMQNVMTPLDIGFFDGAGRLVKTMLMDTYEDGNNRLYSPGQRFQYVLEARVGFFNEHKLSEGRARLVVHSVND